MKECEICQGSQRLRKPLVARFERCDLEELIIYIIHIYTQYDIV